MLLGHKWIKKCTICKGKGHHLSNNQLAKLKVEIRGKLIKKYKKSRKSVSDMEVEEKTRKHIEKSKMLCDMCKGELYITYPHN